MDESLTLVMVPVLSEQMTDTAPRVSTVLRDLHRILFFLIMLATMVRDDVRAIGSPSGMKATAALTQDTIRSGTSIQLEWSFLSHAALNNSEQSMIKCKMVYDGSDIPKYDNQNNHTQDEKWDDKYKSQDFFL